MQITIRNLQKKKIPLRPKKLKTSILKVLKSFGKKTIGEIAVYFVDNKKIETLNFKYRGEKSPTDVLAFELSQKSKIYADIFVSLDTAHTNARIFKTSAAYELCLYIVHGLLHILGFSDRNASQRKKIRKKEREFINFFKF